ncbi:hypothetical protein M514_26979 [Trichuris suis]|uniref:RNA-directed DNA polymerase n=1 Tax=Trichuris suis TaxID=68888 RepID=A0A085MUE7_9BILA|nr:hypothetical protein M514_26979 [Trichuris suis]
MESFPSRRFAQLFPWLEWENGILLVRQTSGIGDEYVVPVIPSTMKGTLMKSCHEAQSAGHLGRNRTLARLRRTAYWIGMDRDVLLFCKKCTVCQRCKLGRPVRAPLKKMPVGMPWERLGADILELPESTAGHRYALVVQDYRVLLNH